MEFEKLITERFSVRKFKADHLPDNLISKLLDAAYKAPTGCNFQPQRILVLNNDESVKKLKNCTKCHFDAPTAFVLVAFAPKKIYFGVLIITQKEPTVIADSS